MTTRCRRCQARIWMRDFTWTDGAGTTTCTFAGDVPHEPLPATPPEEQLGWLDVYAGPPQGWSR